MSPAVLVDGRFLTMQMTGVQRYAREVLWRLPAHVDGEVLVAVPPDRLIDAGDTDRLRSIPQSGRWHGPRGHAWEQLSLPRLVRRSGKPTVLSLASWGPLADRRQVLMLHDMLPQLYGEYFTKSYRALALVLTPLLVRRGVRLATSCDNVRQEICRYYGLKEDAVDIIPPGVGAPFNRWPIDDLDSRDSSYCLMVGSHDRRKNVQFILDWWPQVHAETGLELVVTTRGSSTVRFVDDPGDRPGVRQVVDPADEELAALYAGALCLLSPSRCEGFGLPLLEAMAVGTPFLSTDTGAASALAIVPGQVLPLDATLWVDQIRQWHADGLDDLRKASFAASRKFTWDEAAAAASRSLRRAAAG